MRFKIIASGLALVVLATGLAGADDTPDQKRDKTRKMAAETLQELYKLQPAAQGAIQKSAGYAVFNNTGANVLLLSTVWRVKRLFRFKPEREAGVLRLRLAWGRWKL